MHDLAELSGDQHAEDARDSANGDKSVDVGTVAVDTGVSGWLERYGSPKTGDQHGVVEPGEEVDELARSWIALEHQRDVPGAEHTLGCG